MKRLAAQKRAEMEKLLTSLDPTNKVTRNYQAPNPNQYKYPPREQQQPAPDSLYGIRSLEIDKAKARNTLRLKRLPNPAHAIELNQGRYLSTLRSPADLSKYGISALDYFTMLQAQKGKCAICECVPDRQLSIDHDHATGNVRGLLCSPCNTALGSFKDSAALLNKAIEYLESEGSAGQLGLVRVASPKDRMDYSVDLSVSQ